MAASQKAAEPRAGLVAAEDGDLGLPDERAQGSSTKGRSSWVGSPVMRGRFEQREAGKHEAIPDELPLPGDRRKRLARLGEEVALQKIAAEVGNRVTFLCCFDPLCNDAHLQVLAESGQ